MTSNSPIELHVPRAAMGIPNASPFCLKVEAFCRLTGIEFTRHDCMNPSKGPTGKVPFIIDNGQAIGDSGAIIQHLKQSRGVDPDAGLTPEKLAIAAAMTDMLEEGIYWGIVWMRWLDPKPGKTNLPAYGFFKRIPMGLGPVVFGMISRKVGKQLYMQGLGRHSRDEIIARTNARTDALADWLQDRDTMLDTDQPTTMDCIAWSTLASLLRARPGTDIDLHARTRDSLERYFTAMTPRLGFDLK
ncbi:MAG: glutathione S-transferase C-terminal domain-containing protein [Alphaproteobacteria bacterium]